MPLHADLHPSRIVNMLTRLLFPIAIAVALLIAGGGLDTASGQNVAIWIGPGGGNWSDPNNWLCVVDGTPFSPCPLGDASGFTVNIDNTAAFLDINATPDSLALGVLTANTGGGLDVVDGNTLAVASQFDVGVLNAGSALRILTGGSVSDETATIALGIGSTGNVTVNGLGSKWATAGELDVGVNGTGTLTIGSGGLVTSGGTFIGGGSGPLAGNSGRGTVTVTGTAFNGTPSEWDISGILFVGSPGNGTLTIQNGGVVNAGIVYIANRPGAVGTVTVTGAGSQLTSTSGNVIDSTLIVGAGPGTQGMLTVQNGGVVRDPASVLQIGGAGQGTLLIQNGGVVSDTAGPTSGILIATLAGSVGNVTVSGAGSQLNSVGFLTVGSFGQGTMTISGGGTATTGVGGFIGFSPGAIGTVTVTDAGSQWTTSSTVLVIGESGQGTLTIQNGGVVSDTDASSGIFVGHQAGSVGSVTVTGAGSQMTSAGFVNIGAGGQGTVTVMDGGLVAAGTLDAPGTIFIGTNGKVTVSNGTLQGNVIDVGNLDPLGLINIHGNFTLGAPGTLLLDVAGTGPGRFGRLDISGTGIFDGAIAIDFIDGFGPTAGDSFDLINVAGSADFSKATVRILGLLPGFEFTDTFSGGAFVLVALNNGESVPVPEPSGVLLYGSGIAGLLGDRYLRSRRSQNSVSTLRS